MHGNDENIVKEYKDVHLRRTGNMHGRRLRDHDAHHPDFFFTVLGNEENQQYQMVVDIKLRWVKKVQ